MGDLALSKIVDGVIYETQEEHDRRIEFEDLAYHSGKKRSRNRAKSEKIKLELSIRADGKCEVCGYGFESILHVHHIKPVRLGGSAALSNLIFLCPNCHGLAHHYNHSRRWDSGSYDGWKEGLAGAGLNEQQAERLLLIASKEARVRSDGVIVPYDRPRPLNCVIVDDAGNPLDPLPPGDPQAIEAALKRIEERFGIGGD